MTASTAADRAEREFARQIEREGFPDYGIRCKHGIQGGLHCEWCGNPDKLPKSEQLSGIPRKKVVS